MATAEDADAVTEIYRPYVRDTAISFETMAPEAGEMRSRITTTLARLPWLVVPAPRPARAAAVVPAVRSSPRRRTRGMHLLADHGRTRRS